MIFEIKGIKIKLCFSFAATVTLMLMLSKTSLTLISFFSSVAHETGHIVCLLMMGKKPENISLGFFGMRMVCRAENNLDCVRDSLFLLSGAGVNIIIAAVSAVPGMAGNVIFSQLCAVNGIIAAFNLLPVYTLDGGRALYLLISTTFLSEKANNIILITSYLTVAFLVVFGIYLYRCCRLSVSYAAVTIYLTAQTVVSTEKSLRKGY